MTTTSHALSMFSCSVASFQYHFISLRQMVIPVILLCFRQGRFYNWVIFASYQYTAKFVWKLGACATTFTGFVVYMKAGAISMHFWRYTNFSIQFSVSICGVIKSVLLFLFLCYLLSLVANQQFLFAGSRAVGYCAKCILFLLFSVWHSELRAVPRCLFKLHFRSMCKRFDKQSLSFSTIAG